MKALSSESGVGTDLAFYQQANAKEPQIPLGTTGTLALGAKGPLPWQVVGYAEYCEVAQSADDEQSFWREYLLYHRIEGFSFLVDAQDGWSWATPITGAPEGFGESVKYQGVLYRKLYDYTGQVTYVAGEFYWRLTRDQRTANTDYVGTGTASALRLNREQTAGEDSSEIVWSGGQTLAADAVAAAFRLGADKVAALQRDALPTAFSGLTRNKIIFWIIIILVVLMLFRCGSGGGAADCSQTANAYGTSSQEYRSCLDSQRSGSGFRTGGGAFGGFSSGGGHK